MKEWGFEGEKGGRGIFFVGGRSLADANDK